MNYEWLEDYITSLPHVEHDYKAEWGAFRYMVRGKMFAMRGGDKEGRPIITFKLPPAYSIMLRQEYRDVVPGYYSNKEHWSSLYLEGDVPNDVVREMADSSRKALISTFSKKLRAELEASE